MLHRIARELPEHECVFTSFYADGLLGALAERGHLDFTTLGGRARRMTEDYLKAQGLPFDRRGGGGGYELVVMGTDLIVPDNVRGRPFVLVQEGMTDPEDWRYHLVRSLKLPRFLANTSMTGLSGDYTAFCVASPGYRDLFIRKGAPKDKVVVTGIPNFDDAASFLVNDFPHRGYLLGVTSWLRETLKGRTARASSGAASSSRTGARSSSSSTPTRTGIARGGRSPSSPPAPSSSPTGTRTTWSPTRTWW